MRSLVQWLDHAPIARSAAVLSVALALCGGCDSPQSALKTTTGETASPELNAQFQNAVKNGDLTEIKTLLKARPALAFNKDIRGQTALHIAASKGYKDLAAFLLTNS